MIIDTSALVAVANRERGRESIEQALLTEPGIIPAPVLVELARVTALRGNVVDPDTALMMNELLNEGISIEPFTLADARLAEAANVEHGTGNGRGGTLNLLDLMVYGMALRTRRPILCTGRDFAATGIALHPASRIG